MALTEAEKATAEKIVGQWFWQAAEGHNYRFRHAVPSLTRFYESAPMEADQLRIVVEYLRTQEGIKSFSLNHKLHTYDTPWNAKDVWFQTAAGQAWHGTESTKIRIYQTLIQQTDAEADGPYTVENGCQYKVSHTFYWDVAELPELPESSSGVNYTLQGVTRDRESGLFSCAIERRERVQQDVAEYTKESTLFESTSEEQHLGVKADDMAKTGKAATYGSGKVVRRKISKNADCTSDVLNETVTEKSVSAAVTSARRTLRATIKTTLDRSQASAASAEGLKVGEEIRSEKTPGGLFNNQKSEVTAEAAGKIAEECGKTIFEHTHGTTTNVLTEPTAGDVSEAGEGKVRQRTVRKTEEGSFDVAERETAEQAVSEAVVAVRKTLRGTVRTTLDRNQASAASAEGLKVGEEIRSEKTPGGLFNNQKSEVTAEAAGKIAAECQAASGVHEDTEITNVAAEPTVEQEAAVNKVKTVSFRKTEEGSFDKTVKTVTYTPSTTVATSSYPTETITTTTKIHDTNTSPAAERGNASATPNDHGGATTQVTEFTPIAFDSGWITWDSETQTERGTYKYHHGLRLFRNLSNPPKPTSGSNVSISASVNKFGLYDGALVYSDLYNWVRSSSSSLEGGIQEGTRTGYQFRQNKNGKVERRTVTLPVVYYYGRGSEGAEAVHAANGTTVSGISLPGRCYGTGAPTFGAWTEETGTTEAEG